MSLFHPTCLLRANITFADVDDNETVYAAKNVWDALQSFGKSDAVTTNITVSLKPPQYLRTTLDSSLIAIAACAPDTLSVLPGHIVVSSIWKDRYPLLFPDEMVCSSLFGSSEYTVSVVNTVVLTDVFLVASSQAAQEYAVQQPLDFEAWLARDQRVIRHGDKYSIELPSSSEKLGNVLRYEVVIAEPVLQGHIKVGVTRLLVLPGPDEEPTRSPSLSNGDAFEAEASNVFREGESEVFEIDETFLANSASFPLPTTNGHTEHAHNHLTNGDHASSAPPHTTSYTYNGQTFRGVPLPYHPTARYDEASTVFVRTTDLSRLGVFSGDWAIACSQESNNNRLVRVLTTNDDVPALQASPTLLYNLATDRSGAVEPAFMLRSSPFGSQMPPVPTAKIIALARIASPISVDRTYQSLFLRALQAYFEKTKRLVKSGDVIAIHITLDSAYKEQEFDRIDSEEKPSKEDLEIDNIIEDGIPNAVVYFLVTNLEHDVVKSNGSKPFLDSYMSATMGEMGCWIDPSFTRVIQAGVEHSFVPQTIDLNSIPSISVNNSEIGTSIDSNPYVQLYKCVSAFIRPGAAEFGLAQSILLKGSRGVGKRTTVLRVANELGMHVLDINCFELIGETDLKTEGMVRARFEKAASCSPCIFLLRHIDALSQSLQAPQAGKEPALVSILKECIVDLSREWKVTGYPVIVVATASNPDRTPVGLLSCFKHEISLEAPSESERLAILQTLLRSSKVAMDVELHTIATQTAALLANDLVDLVQRTHLCSIERVLGVLSDYNDGCNMNDMIAAGIPLTAGDFERAINSARVAYSQSIGAPKIPNVTWDDVGGLASVKADILDTIQLPLEHPELFAKGLKQRSGILLYGPPGTGKTMLAKAVATSCSLNFFSVKGPELLNMYIGESEANVRRVFQRARDAKPCVIFFDELDSVAPKRGNQGDSGGVMDRIVSQLLAELDGMSDGTGADVFVIGATNRPDLLDPALLRPGRFDRMIYLGISDTHGAQYNIIQALTRKFQLDPDLDLRQVAEQCPFNYTGADFYALCSDAMLNAMSRKAEEIEAKISELNRSTPIPGHPYPIMPQYYLSEFATDVETDIVVSRKDFDKALSELVPSVSRSEMEHYGAIQRQFLNEVDATVKFPDAEIRIANAI